MSNSQQLETRAIEPSLTLEPTQSIVLLVDDCLKDRETIKRYLLSDRKNSYKIFEAVTAAEGLDLYQRCQPDVVLLDYRLPDSDGLEFLEQIQHSENENYPPVILLTGQGNERVAVAAMKMGVCDYLIKGQVMPDELQASVNCAIENAQLRAQLRQEKAERQRAEDALHQSQETIRRQLSEIESIYNTAPIGLCFIDTDLRFVRINEQLAQINGLPASEHIGRTLREIIPEMADDLEPLYRQVIESGEPILNLEVSGTNRAQPGVVRDWLVSYYPLKDGEERVLGVNVMVQEITESKKAAIALYESENKLRLFVKYAPVSVAMFDRNMLYIAASQRWVDNYNLGSIEAILGRSHYDIFPQVPDRWRQVHQRGLAGESAKCEDDLLVLADGSQQFLRWEVQPWHDSLDEVGGILVFVEDISDRIHAEIALKNSERRYASLAKLSPVGIWRSDRNGRDTYANDRCCEIMGLAPGESLGLNWAIALHPDDRERVLQEWLQAVEKNLPFHSEYRFQHADGTIRWVIGEALPETDDDERIIGYIGTITDISDRKQTETILRQQAQIIDQIHDSVISTDLDGYITSWNQGAHRLFGYSVTEAMGQHISLLYPEPQMQEVLQHQVIEPLLQQGEHQVEVTMQRASGEPIEALLSLSLLRDSDGNLIGMVGYSMDITERKQAERALEQSEERLRLATEAADLGMWFWDLIEEELVWTARCKTLFGLAPNTEMTYERFLDVLHPDDRDRTKAAVTQAIQDRVEYNIEYRTVWPDGTVHWIAARGQAFYNECGEPIRMMGTAQDISERKLSEESLRASSEQLKIAQQSANAGLWNWDISTNQLIWSDEYYELYGLERSLQPSYENWLASIDDSDRSRVDREVREAMQNRHKIDLEYRIIHSQRGLCWLNALGDILYNANGEPIRMTGITLDVTERKIAEERLRESEELLQLGVYVAGFALAKFDYASHTVELSPEAAALYGLPLDEPIVTRSRIHETFHPEEREELLEIIERVIDPAGSGWFARDHRVVWQNGEVRWLSVRKQVFFDRESESPRPLYAILAAIDITERKRAEEQLRENNAILNAINQATTNLIYAKDRQGRVLMANPATIALDDKPEEEILGRTDIEFFSNRSEAEQIMANDRLVMETGRVQVFEEQVKTPSGTRIYLSTKSPYLDETGNVIGL
nr:PAS domain S-box protein [Hydrococcus sp. Prado102]